MIFYADQITESIKRTQDAVNYRREKQLAYNQEHGITPRSVKRAAQASLHVYDGSGERGEEAVVAENADDVATVIAELEVEMADAAGRLEFERARDSARSDQRFEIGRLPEAGVRALKRISARAPHAAAVRGKVGATVAYRQ